MIFFLGLALGACAVVAGNSTLVSSDSSFLEDHFGAVDDGDRESREAGDLWKVASSR